VVAARLGLSAPRWQDEAQPSVAAHLGRVRLPAPAGEREIAAALDELLCEPLDPQLSPWRMWLIEGAARGSALFVRLHHCMGDGFALVELLLGLADHRRAAQPDQEPRPPATPLRFARVSAVARRIPRALSDLGHLLRLPFDAPSELRGELAGKRRIAWSAAVDLARIKALAGARGATVNDLLLAVLSGALRRYVLERGGVPHAVRAMVPVNLRTAAASLDPRHGNWFGLVLVPLPLAEVDRERRVAQLKSAIDAIKHSEQAPVSLAVLAALGRVPRPLQRLAEGVLARKASLVVSNVPGPREPLQLAGRKVGDMMFWVPHPAGLACGISILSYAGRLRVGVRSDVAVLSDPERIARLFEDELRAWETACVRAPM
jgi:diacylglycerol O-acyltransferase